MYPHGVDPLQFTGPVLSLVFWDIWTDGLDRRNKSEKCDRKMWGGERERKRGGERGKVDTQNYYIMEQEVGCKAQNVRQSARREEKTIGTGAPPFPQLPLLHSPILPSPFLSYSTHVV